MYPLHEVDEPAKVQRIAVSMEENGWQGAPLVKWCDQLLTGVHRYEAWTRVLELRYQDIPTIEIEEVFEEAGLDWDELLAEYDHPTMNNWQTIEQILFKLPSEICEKYGIDL